MHTNIYTYIYIHPYVRTYVRKFIRTYIHTHTHIIHTYIYAYVYTCMYTHTHTHTHTHTTYLHKCLHAYTCIHTYIHTYASTYIYIYIYICIFSNILTMDVMLHSKSFQQFYEDSFLQFQSQAVHNLHFCLTMNMQSLKFFKSMLQFASSQGQNPRRFESLIQMINSKPRTNLSLCCLAVCFGNFFLKS